MIAKQRVPQKAVGQRVRQKPPQEARSEVSRTLIPISLLSVEFQRGGKTATGSYAHVYDRIYDLFTLHLTQVCLVRRVYTKMGQGKAKQGEARQGEAPKLVPNLPLREWTRWKLRWAAHKRHTGFTDEYICMDQLWDFFSQELESFVVDNLKLDFDLDLDTTEEQFLERVRRLAVSQVAKAAKEAKVADVAEVAKEINESSTPEPKKAETGEVLVNTPHSGDSINDQEKKTAKLPAPKKTSLFTAMATRSIGGSIINWEEEIAESSPQEQPLQ